VHDGGGNGTGSFVIKIWSDAAKLTGVRVAGFRHMYDKYMTILLSDLEACPRKKRVT